MSKKKITMEGFIDNVLRRWKKSVNKNFDDKMEDLLKNGTPAQQRHAVKALNALEKAFK